MSMTTRCLEAAGRAGAAPLVLDNPGLCNACVADDYDAATPLAVPCQADLNDDGRVSTEDLLILLGEWA